MRESELDRLVNDELDGVATPEQAARLKTLLAEDESHRMKYREMRRVFGLLHRVEVVEAPADLKDNVLRAIRSQAHSEPSRQDVLALLGEAFRRRSGFGLAYSFVLGAAIGALALALVTGGFGIRARTPNADFSGSMLPPPSTSKGAVLDRAHFEVNGCHVEVLVRAVPGGVAVQIGTRSSQEADIHVRFDSNRLAPVAFRRWEERLGTIEIRPGDVRIHQGGDGRCELLLDSAAAGTPPLQVIVTSGDRSEGRALRTMPEP